MQEDVISNYVDRSGVQSDTEFMLAALNTVYDGVKKVNNVKVDISGSQGFKELNGSVQQLNGTMQQLTHAFSAALNIQTKYNQEAQQGATSTKLLVDSHTTLINKTVSLTENSKLLQSALADVKANLEKMVQSGTASADEIAQLNQQEQVLTQLVNQQAKGFSSLTVELNVANRALQLMREAGLSQTDQFRQMQTIVNKTKQEYNEFSNVQKLLSSEAPLVQGLAIAVRGLGGAYATGVGAVALFGDENGKLNEHLNKLIGVMSILQGLHEVTTLLKQKAAIATAIETAAQKAYNFVVGESVGAMAALRVALAAVGIGILIAGLATLAIGLASSSDKTKELAARQKELADAIKGVNDAVKNEQDIISHSNDKAIQSLKNQLKAAEEQNLPLEKTAALRKKISDLEVDQSKKASDDAQQRAKNQALDQELIPKTIDQYTRLKEINQQIERGQLSLGDAVKKKGEIFKEINGVEFNGETALATVRDNNYNKFKDLQQKQIDLAKDLAIAIKGSKKGDPTADDDEVKRIQKKIDANNAELDSAKSYYDQSENLQKNYSDAVGNQQALDAQIAKFNADEKRKYDTESANLTANLIIEQNQRILNDDRSTLQQRIAALREILVQQNKIAQSDYSNIAGDPSKTRVDKAIALKALNDQIAKNNIEFNQNFYKTNEESRQRNLAAEKEAATAQLSFDSEINDEISKNTELSLSTRLQAIKKFSEDQKAIAGFELDEKLSKPGLSPEEKLSAEKIYETKILQISVDTNKAVTENLKLEIDKQQHLREIDVENIKAIYASQSSNTSVQYASDVIELNNSLLAKKTSYFQYLEDRKKLDQKYSKESLENTVNALQAELKQYDGAERIEAGTLSELNMLKEHLATAQKNKESDDIIESLSRQVDAAQKEYDVAKKNADKKKDLIKQVGAAEKAASDDAVKTDDEDQHRRLSKFEAFAEKIGELNQQIGSFGDALHDRKIQQYQVESDALDTRYQKEQDLINQSVTNQIDKQKQLAEAQAKYNAQKQLLNTKERQEEERKARFDKGISAFGVIVKTAEAVARDLVGNKFLIPFDIAIGAVELAAILAAPIPKYAKGKNIDKVDNYQGFAYINDGGKKEAIIRDNGRIEFPQKMNSIEWLGKNDVVLPDAKMLAWNATVAADNISGNATSQQGLSQDDFMRGINKLNKTLKGIPQPTTYVADPTTLWMQGKITTKQYRGY
jgi:hypothetical protein